MYQTPGELATRTSKAGRPPAELDTVRRAGAKARQVVSCSCPVAGADDGALSTPTNTEPFALRYE